MQMHSDFTPGSGPVSVDGEIARKDAEDRRVEDWIDDCLVPEAFMSPIQALVEHDHDLLCDLVATYWSGDHAEVEQAAGSLARRLIELIKREA